MKYISISRRLRSSKASSSICSGFTSLVVCGFATAGLLTSQTANAQITTFNYTGVIQDYTVPLNVSSITVQLWGAGGGGFDNSGGGGAYVTGALSVTPGEMFDILVGQGGVRNGSSLTFGGGGLPNGPDAASGGGRSAIIAASAPTVDFADAAGGGGTGTGDSLGGNGGAGGLATGTAGGGGATGGGGGTQSLGGQGGSGGGMGVNGHNGSQYQGGNGGDEDGGGGGGYYGGGGGAVIVTPFNDGGGGGGSSLTPGGFTGQAGSGATPGGTAALNYESNLSIGVGGSNTDGGNGEVVITAVVPATTPEPGALGLLAGSASAAVGMIARSRRRNRA